MKLQKLKKFKYFCLQRFLPVRQSFTFTNIFIITRQGPKIKPVHTSIVSRMPKYRQITDNLKYIF